MVAVSMDNEVWERTSIQIRPGNGNGLRVKGCRVGSVRFLYCPICHIHHLCDQVWKLLKNSRQCFDSSIRTFNIIISYIATPVITRASGCSDTHQKRICKYEFMARVIYLLLALALVSIMWTPSNAWRRRRRRRRRCSVTHCRVSSWSSWSSCSRSCGGGTSSRSRRKTVSESCGGRCPYSLSSSKRCNTNCCPVNCVYTWGSWSSCVGCGISTQTRTPRITRYSSCNGRSCPAKQTQSCDTGV